MKKTTLHARTVAAMNRAGLSDMHGELYNTHGPEIVRFVLRMARRHLRPTISKAPADGVPLVLMGERSFPSLHYTVGSMGKGKNKIRVAMAMNFSCFYFFVGKRIVVMPTTKLCEAIGPRVVALAKA